MANKKVTDCMRIIRYLETHEWISKAVSVHVLGCYNFAGRIFDLKKSGYVFEDRMIYTKDEEGNPTHWKEFKLIGRAA